jgi:trans-2,3-dihydro-3-hydroxyanthranilate isomerase
MMIHLAYRTLNVFTRDGDRPSGNPLCVFEDGRALSDSQMQALARQLNLSETTFVLPASVSGATARVRIFTPTFEMPFAGHPTLGTAHVVRELHGSGDRVALEMKAGVVEVTASGDVWTLRAAKRPATRPPRASPAELASMLGLPAASIGGDALWVDTGVEQLVVPLAREEDVLAARPDGPLLKKHAFSEAAREAMAYVWARRADGGITARFLFLVHGGVVEDPATGSACANLGGWLLATGAPLPVSVEVRQGDMAGRPSRLGLRVDADRNVFVEGDVIEIGRGHFVL